MYAVRASFNIILKYFSGRKNELARRKIEFVNVLECDPWQRAPPWCPP
jgi:hypothetical protein